MTLPLDLANQRYGCLVALRREGRRWLCQCDCGRQKWIQATHLRSGATRSCGHLIGVATRKRCTKHGLKPRGSADGTYSSWCAMWTRCTNPNQPGWHSYGGRGVSVCERWKDFAAFLADMGPRPDGHTLDRIDCDKDYSPDNCRWETTRRQNRNRRNTLRFTCNGRTQPLADWAEELGVPYATLYGRLVLRGVAPEIALQLP